MAMDRCMYECKERGWQKMNECMHAMKETFYTVDGNQISSCLFFTASCGDKLFKSYLTLA